MDGQCTHIERKREIFVVSTPELKLPLNKGCKILQIYEVLVFELMCDLFAEYVMTFLKGKKEASGFPPDIIGIGYPELDIFIDAFEEKERVKLDTEKIKNN